MKKKILAIALSAITVLSCVIFPKNTVMKAQASSSQLPSASSSVVYEQDFEDVQNFSELNWTKNSYSNDTATWELVSEGENKQLVVDNYTNWTNGSGASAHILVPETIMDTVVDDSYEVEFDLQFLDSDKNTRWCAILLNCKDTYTSAELTQTRLGFRRGGYGAFESYVNGTKTTHGKGTWDNTTYPDFGSSSNSYWSSTDKFTVKIVVDYSTSTLRVYIDNVLKAVSQTDTWDAYKAASELNSALVFNVDAKCKVAIDNIKVTAPSIKINSVQMDITDSLALNFEMKVPDGETPSITIDGPGEDVRNSSMKQDGEMWTYQYSDIRAQEMNDTLTITVTTETANRTFTYSVMEYCKKLLAMEDSDFAGYTAEQIAYIRELVVDLVQYGAAVQTYRGEEDILTNQITEMLSYDLNQDFNLEELSAVGTVLSGSQSDSYTWTGVTLVLKDKVSLRAKFSAMNIDGLTVKVKVGEQELTDAEIISADTDGEYYVYFDGIRANQYGQTITFAFMKDGESVGAQLNYSVNTYLKAASETDDTKLLTLLKATNEYGQAAVKVANNG